ncbi:MAG: hypothetical protein IT427_19360 [Pirellulales bacterium]|nr:hypothetical protein [Pirellulales bacterium]
MTLSADADVLLVGRCLNGDKSAWQEMYDQCQPKLLLSVRSLIGRNGHGVNLAEEIAARVWLSLVAANGVLLNRYDANRGSRLTTFLASLARHELLKHWRGEQRREDRERKALRNRPYRQIDGLDRTQIYWHEFLTTLSAREQQFVQEVLLASPDQDSASNFTPTNAWQLRKRVMAKLRRYFNGRTV